MIQRIGAIGFILLLAVGWVGLLDRQQSGGEPAADITQQSGGLPQVTYLGEGPGDFQIDSNHIFIVKHLPFRFEYHDGPSYTAGNRERVWSTTFVPVGGFPIYHDYHNFGVLEAGCLFEYGQIDDDIDNRINRFFLNGVEIREVPQGMVTYDSFIIPETGELTFFAEDSVAMASLPCENQVTPTPPPTETATATAVFTATVTSTPTTEVTATLTATPEISATLTATPSPSATTDPSVTPTQTPDDGPLETPTATATLPPTATASATATATTPATATPSPTATNPPGEGQGTATPTATKEPRLNTCLRINFDLGGDEARRGLYVVREVGGRELASWYAEEGWMDSGWIYDIDITHPTVYVQVFFHHGDGSPPVEMRIVNPAPGTTYGWLARGQCHALEVAWPE